MYPRFRAKKVQGERLRASRVLSLRVKNTLDWVFIRVP